MIKINKKDFLNKILELNEAFYGLHKNAALFYGQIKKNNKNFLEYYFYDLEKKEIIKYNVIIKKNLTFNKYYLTFRFKEISYKNHKIKWEILTFKTKIKRFIKSLTLFNKYYFYGYFIDKKLKNVKNIHNLYIKHLEEIKKQFICLNIAETYNVSYELCIKNYLKVLKADFKFLKQKNN